MNETLTPKEPGSYLNIHIRTIYRLMKTGKILENKVSERRRFKKAILDEWLSGKKVIPERKFDPTICH